MLYEFVTSVTDSFPATLRKNLDFAHILCLYFHFEDKEGKNMVVHTLMRKILLQHKISYTTHTTEEVPWENFRFLPSIKTLLPVEFSILK